ncbi:hypothetical protein F0L68_23690 [Solihabitans fulvus]|uniref:EF-hand domain-containing protein n=1 Tax=Solihabitans fulvus TaxID=1892852 RepID=A0A5B2X6J6_9PSEU|nr:EF-hand domain-containing protein [Solihabitans fulvus]KAA2258825.1 hypothetical protein F0L68_23690 [Solihabitans fulvus]
MSTVTSDKLDKRFNTLDHDNNGWIERGDVFVTARGVLAQFGVSPDSPKAATLINNLLNVWDSLAGLLNPDVYRPISVEEFRVVVTAHTLGHSDGYTQLFQPVVLALVDIADTNGDGVIEKTEGIRLLIALGTAEADAEKAFQAIDVDQDGQLSVHELVAAFRAYFLSEDPQHRASSLLG